jgi:hypothetical protein
MLALHSFTQDLPVRYYEIIPAKHKKNQPVSYTKVPNSLYNRIEFLDAREDTSLIGTIGVGLLKRDARLKMRMPFQPQLQNLVDSLTDGSAAHGELLFQLRNFFFIEESATRYCYLQAGLYAKTPEGYTRLSILDTVLVITINDVHGAILNAASQVFTDYLSDELTHKPGDARCTLQDINNYDSIEKSRIPVFNTPQFTDGIYYDYYSFSNQLPDLQGTVQTDRKGNISRIDIQDSTGKKVKLKSKNCYAVVNKGRAYIATEYGYYPLERINKGLFFTGDVKVAASESDKNGGQLALGLLGRALASAGTQTTYDMIIDHVSGVFIHLHKIIKTDPMNP